MGNIRRLAVLFVASICIAGIGPQVNAEGVTAAGGVPNALASVQPAALPLCASCHGPEGGGASRGVPRLAGQNAEYLFNALLSFKTGKRPSSTMQPIAQSLSAPEMRALGDYFSRVKATPIDAAVEVTSQVMTAGKVLAESGAANVPACFSCHAARGLGAGARFPRIASQPAEFVVARIQEFQKRARAKKPEPGSMTEVAARLTDQQTRAVAAYLAKLDP